MYIYFLDACMYLFLYIRSTYEPHIKVLEICRNNITVYSEYNTIFRMATTKRKREIEWWQTTVDWIVSKSGSIHEAILWSEERRELVVTNDIPKGSKLMEIPSACLISAVGLERGSIKGLYNEEQDVWIAALLAKQQGGGAEYQYYLNTLPGSTSFDALPRRWSEYDGDRLLTGSSALDRIRKSTAGARADYELVQEWLGDAPCFAAFDDMLAAVTSRAFAGFGVTHQDCDIAMVPILDLCNHRRGNVTKNISYRRTMTGVEVTAFVDLSKDDVLAITYGAKGNAQLLVNYGFCIPNNVEADGSSNDVVELKLKTDQAPVEMRTGPKSFTFGPLCKAIELFHSQNDQRETNDEERDMEDFLSEEEDEEDDMDEMYNGDMGEDEDDEKEKEETIQAELKAIRLMDKALESLLAGYSMTNDQVVEYTTKGGFAVEAFAAMLIHAEKRTIQFFQLAIGLVSAKLRKEDPGQFNWTLELTKEDKSLLERQADELATAFIRIRYSDLSRMESQSQS
jgi:hypothetical protein